MLLCPVHSGVKTQPQLDPSGEKYVTRARAISLYFVVIIVVMLLGACKYA